MKPVQRHKAQAVDAAPPRRRRIPEAIMRAAFAENLAEEEHAEDTTNPGPASPR